MKKWTVVVLMILSGQLAAQNSVFFGHYMFNASNLNPAAIGGERVAFAALQHRTQWLGYQTSFDGRGGSPTSQMFTLVVPTEGLPLSAMGVNITADHLGPVSNYHLQLPLAYTRELRRGQLSFGVAPAIYSQTMRFDELRFNDPSDPFNVGTRETQSQFDLAAGLNYVSDKNFSIGAGVTHLMQPGFNFGLDSLDNRQSRTLNIHGGKSIRLSPSLTLALIGLVRSNFSGITFDAGAMLYLPSDLWVGLTVRRAESANVYLGYSMLENKKLRVGYSFDYVIQNQEGKAATSHEIFVRYDLPDIRFGGKKAVKTPRFSF